MHRPVKERFRTASLVGLITTISLGFLLFTSIHATTISYDCTSCHNNNPSSGAAKINITAFSSDAASHYNMNDQAQAMALSLDTNTSALYHMEEGDGGDVNDSSSNANHARIWGDTRLLMHFDEGSGTTAKDQTAYGNNGTLQGDTFTSDTPSGTGSAISFNGSGQYVEISDSPSITIPSLNVSWGAWIKYNSSTNTYMIFQKGGATTSGYNAYITASSGDLTCYIGGSFPFPLFSSVTAQGIPAGEWHHFMCVQNTTDLSVWIDGTFNASTYSEPPIDTTGFNLYIGYDPWGTYSDFNGSMDEVAIYNRSLSAAEISSMYNAQVAQFVEWGTGRFGSGVVLDGESEFLNASTSSSLNITGGITMEAWVNLTATGREQTILRKEGAYALEINSTNYLNASLWLDTGLLSLQSSSPLTAGPWWHVAATFTGTTLTLYINGSANGSTTTTSSTINKTSYDLYIGSSSGTSRFFQGILDEVHILDRARTAAEIASDAGTGPSTDLNRRCWACHGNGTQPPVSFDHNTYPRVKDPWNCTDCHIPGNYSATIVESHRINDTRVNTTVRCSSCHNNSIVPNNDAGENETASSNVSHYGTNQSLNPGGYNTTNCTTCHRNPAIGAKWGGATQIRHSDENYISCSRCHNSSSNISQPLYGPFRKLHDGNLADARLSTYVSVHYNYDWEGDDGNESEPGKNPADRKFESCPACHNNSGTQGQGANATEAKICEDCHTPSGNGPYQGPLGTGANQWVLRSDYDPPGTGPRARAPMVYDHYYNSSGVNVSNQSGAFGGSSVRPSTCYDYNNATGLGSCHGVSFHINQSTDGKYAHSKDRPSSAISYRNDTAHYQLVVDYLPDTTNCTFCHKQSNATKRSYWGGAPYVGDNMGTSSSQCLGCHLNESLTLYNFHQAVETDGTRTWGLMTCGSCHFDYQRMSGYGKAQFWMNETMFRSSVHGNTSKVLCTDCHTNATSHQANPTSILPPENAWKWCECCHVINGTSSTWSRHNLTYKPQDNMYDATTSVIKVTNCTWCHDAGIYNNAKATYNRTSGKDCRYCHPFPDNLPGGD